MGGSRLCRAQQRIEPEQCRAGSAVEEAPPTRQRGGTWPAVSGGRGSGAGQWGGWLHGSQAQSSVGVQQPQPCCPPSLLQNTHPKGSQPGQLWRPAPPAGQQLNGFLSVPPQLSRTSTQAPCGGRANASGHKPQAKAELLRQQEKLRGPQGMCGAPPASPSPTSGKTNVLHQCKTAGLQVCWASHLLPLLGGGEAGARTTSSPG